MMTGDDAIIVKSIRLERIYHIQSVPPPSSLCTFHCVWYSRRLYRPHTNTPGPYLFYTYLLLPIYRRRRVWSIYGVKCDKSRLLPYSSPFYYSNLRLCCSAFDSLPSSTQVHEAPGIKTTIHFIHRQLCVLYQWDCLEHLISAMWGGHLYIENHHSFINFSCTHRARARRALLILCCDGSSQPRKIIKWKKTVLRVKPSIVVCGPPVNIHHQKPRITIYRKCARYVLYIYIYIFFFLNNAKVKNRFDWLYI